VSYDVDFVIQLEATGSSGRAVLRVLGFEPSGDHYMHRNSPYLLEFPTGPLAIGDDLVGSWETVRRSDEVLYVISRTDSVRDRLAAYYHWGDAVSFATAVGVARSGSIDVDVIESWSARERKTREFGRFLAEVKTKQL
jgi:hypothetical protein